MPDGPSREILSEAEAAVGLARRAGADDVVASVHWGRSTEFEWRDGRLEKVQEDQSRSLSLALYVDGRYARHSTNDLDPRRLERFLEGAVALTRLLEPDPWRKIPDPALYEGRSGANLELVDPGLETLDREARVDLCREIEAAARAHEDVVSAFAAVSDGRVFDAETARGLGLVDEIGDLHAAIETAKRAAELDEATVVRYRRSGESADTLHARWHGEPDGLAFSAELELLRAAGPRFLYLWDPVLAP